MTLPSHTSHETLDPPDWEEFRALAHRMVDDSLEFLRTLRERAPWESMPRETRDALTNQPVPRLPESAERAYSDFTHHVLPFTNGNRHPRFWGWIQGSGTPLAMMADMLAAGMNAHLAGLDQAPKLVELQVIAWLAELNRLTTEVQAQTKAITDIQEEARRAGVPPGWLR